MILPEDMLAIDPVESALAVIGVEPILSKEVERVRMPEVKEMHNLDKFVYSEAKRVVEGQASSVPITVVNYKKMLKQLTDGYNVGQLESMVNAFPPALHEVSADFLIKAKQVVDYLKTLFPIATKETLLGPVNILPPALAIRRFATSLDVLDDPKRIFIHISCGSLLKSQVAAMEAIYPTFSKAVTHAFKEAGTEAKAAKSSFQLPAKVEIGYGVWAGIPRVSPALQTKLQNNFKKANAEKPKPAGAEGSSTSVVAKESMTQTQQSLYPQKG